MQSVEADPATAISTAGRIVAGLATFGRCIVGGADDSLVSVWDGDSVPGR